MSDVRDQLSLDKYARAIVDKAQEQEEITLDEIIQILWSIDDDGYWLRPRARRLVENLKNRGLLKQVTGKIAVYEAITKRQK